MDTASFHCSIYVIHGCYAEFKGFATKAPSHKTSILLSPLIKRLFFLGTLCLRGDNIGLLRNISYSIGYLIPDVTKGCYVTPTELEYWWIIRSTNMSSLRDYKLMDFDGNNANFQSSDRSDMLVVRHKNLCSSPRGAT